MNKKIRTDAVDHLFEAILCLQNKEECYSFFEDLCTVNELLSLSQRFEVASMLRDKKTYLDIVGKIADDKGITLDREELFSLAERFAVRKGNRSPRTARQFIDSFDTEK